VAIQYFILVYHSRAGGNPVLINIQIINNLTKYMEKNKANEVEVSAIADNGQSNPENVSLSVFFQKDSYSIYVHKKTEKLVSAIYLLTGLLNESEPLKTRLRAESLNLLSKGLSSPLHSLSLRTQITNEFIASALEIISLLEVAKIARLISPMNHEIIMAEFNSLLKVIEESNHNDQSSSLSTNFFTTDNFLKPQPNNLSNSYHSEHNNLVKEKNITTTSGVIKDNKELNVLNKTIKIKPTKTSEKPNRSEQILSLMKKDKPMTIKDFAVSVKGCSEKTLQRELLSLVAKGLIKKEGERRWSKYSLL
jgi:hypothetical protein